MRTRVTYDSSGNVTAYELLPPKQTLRELLEDEDALLELRALTARAWELRGQEGFRDAIAAVVDWHDSRYQRAYERRHRKLAAVLQVLRETSPPEQKEWVGEEPPIPVGG